MVIYLVNSRDLHKYETKQTPSQSYDVSAETRKRDRRKDREDILIFVLTSSENKIPTNPAASSPDPVKDLVSS